MQTVTFHRIALMGRQGVDSLSKTLIEVQNYLQSLGHEVFIEANHATEQHTFPPTASAQLQAADLLIVVGGDGSLLNAAHIAVAQNIPVLGINKGRLGFLTDIHPHEIHKIHPILQGHYKKEQRFLLHARITHNNTIVAESVALNDVVLLPSQTPQMIEFDTYINHEFLCSQRADGLIVATPTGSTAYALSGGGPILHPQLPAIVLVPMFPHTLSSRPIVVSSHETVQIRIAETHNIEPFISCDGQTRIPIGPGFTIHIQPYEKPLCLIHAEDYNYYDTLRNKLEWGKPIVSS